MIHLSGNKNEDGITARNQYIYRKCAPVVIQCNHYFHTFYAPLAITRGSLKWDHGKSASVSPIVTCRSEGLLYIEDLWEMCKRLLARNNSLSNLVTVTSHERHDASNTGNTTVFKQLPQANNKKIIKDPHHWRFVSSSPTGDEARFCDELRAANNLILDSSRGMQLVGKYSS